MGLTLAMTGKGGVGKTTLSALQSIGWCAGRNAGSGGRCRLQRQSERGAGRLLSAPPSAAFARVRASEAQALKGVSKQEFLDLRVQEALVEQHGYDLIVMGRPEGQGCYCFANNVLRDVLRTAGAELPPHRARQRGRPGAYLAPHFAFAGLSVDRFRLHGARHPHRAAHLRAGR